MYFPNYTVFVYSVIFNQKYDKVLIPCFIFDGDEIRNFAFCRCMVTQVKAIGTLICNTRNIERVLAGKSILYCLLNLSLTI